MEQLTSLFDLFLHLDQYLLALISQYGTWTYAILFFAIFMGTGFVVTPFIPSDSLLFAAGTFAALGGLNVGLLLVLLMVAVIGGDTVNYWIGRYLGDRVSHVEWIKKEYLDRTQTFFQKHGGKTVFLARFIPIVRTFAPFMAGTGKMPYGYFFSYNAFAGIVWVLLFTLMGFFFGDSSWVRKNFESVIIVIALVSSLPILYELWKDRREALLKKAEELKSMSEAQALEEQKNHGKGDMFFGIIVLIIGIFITVGSYLRASPGGTYIVTWGAVLWGAQKIIVGMTKYFKK